MSHGSSAVVSVETMNTTTLNNRSIVRAIPTSPQRGTWGYQQRPAYKRAVARPVASRAAHRELSFREILEREIGSDVKQDQRAKAEMAEEKGAFAQTKAPFDETSQFLTGYWA